MYKDGEGIPQNYPQAHMWFNLAGAQRHPDAKENRDALAEQITPSQIQEAQKLARNFKSKKEKPKK